MKVAVVGSGRMGAALGRIWAQCGRQVTFSFSRNEETLQGLSREVGGAFGSVAEAVANADAVLLAVPWPFVDLALSQAGDLSGKIVLNCCVPHDEEEEHLVVGSHTSGAEELAKRYPDVRWVSAFNTAPSESLSVVHARRDQAPRPQLLFYGDDERAKRVAETLIRDVGFEPLDLGGLKMPGSWSPSPWSRRFSPMTVPAARCSPTDLKRLKSEFQKYRERNVL